MNIFFQSFCNKSTKGVVLLYNIYLSKTKMDKKEYLTKILVQLEPIWNLAKGLRILIELWHLDDNLLDVITQAVEWAIHTTKDAIAKKRLEKGLSVLQQLKQREAESKAQDEKELAELDQMIEQI